MDGHLGRGVQRNAGEVFTGDTRDGQVLQDDAVHTHRLEGGQVVDKKGEFRFLYQRVEGDVDLFAVAVGVGGHAFHL